jgi:UDP-N-acetylglucosamine acyltransferase
MVGSQTAVDSDVIPFAIAVGNRAKLTGINVIGLERRGFDADQIVMIRSLYKTIFRGKGVFADRLAAARVAHAGNHMADEVFAFIDGAGRNGICQAQSG